MDAKALVAALGGRWFGTYGMTRCPAHDDAEPSLSVSETKAGKLLVKCHASCRQEAVLHALQLLGLWPRKSGQSRFDPAPSFASDRNERMKAALKIWSSTSAAPGTLVEHYLISRGIVLPPPSALRSHQKLKHPAGELLPAMVALVTNGVDGSPQAIHRTYLAPDGEEKAAASPQRAMFGPCRGGVVRLAQANDFVMVGEGIETCLAVMQATSKPAWAAPSTSGLRALNLPENIRYVTILADGDDAGEAAATHSAARWVAEGRHVRIAHAPRGLDFNDVLMSGLPARNAA